MGQKDADRIIELFNRMSDRLHNEELRIQEQNHFLDQLIAASPAGVLIMDIGHRIDSSNPALDRMLGVRSIEPYRGQLLQDSPLPCRTAPCPCSDCSPDCSRTRAASSRPTPCTSTAAPSRPSWTGASPTLSTWSSP